jgi:hypothetical protein
MKFIEPELKIALTHLLRLTEQTIPKWGSLSPIGMVEHLTDAINMASGMPMQNIEVPEKYWGKMIEILNSDAELPKNFKATFAPENRIIRHAQLKEAIEEFTLAWRNHQKVFQQEPNLVTNHPNYGPMNKNQWDRLLSKHLTHHFLQFEILKG